MFGPNTYFLDNVNICYSHRDKTFFDLFSEVRNKFSETFDLKDYDILFIPGSGTIGLEALFFSCKRKIKVIGNDGTFKRRWINLGQTYLKRHTPPHHNKKEFELYCRLETSQSKTFYKEGCFIDAISAFPYYDIPKNTLGFVTCLNKQLGSYVGLAVVGIRKDIWNDFIDEGITSYLNLSRYKNYHSMSQTPSTAPTHIYEHFLKVLNSFDIQEFRQRVDYVSDLVVNAVGKENVIGETRCPCITLKNGIIPEFFARKYDIYGYWAGRPNYQIFTYTDKIDNYKKVFDDLKNYL